MAALMVLTEDQVGDEPGISRSAISEDLAQRVRPVPGTNTPITSQ